LFEAKEVYPYCPGLPLFTNLLTQTQLKYKTLINETPY
jgi:hypothetical protein